MALFAALAVMLAMSVPSNAATVTDHGDQQQALERQMLDTQESLDRGETALAATVDGYDLHVKKDASGGTVVVATPEGGDPDSEMAPQGVCTHLVTAGVFALGAAVIGAAAATGGLVVAGVFLSPQVLGLLAGAMGSYAAV